jgi:predicted transposase YbfD/YdcC
MQSTTKLQKVVPKGAQRKFSAQKSFLRECRAKYRRNIRRRSSKDVPKGMQNLHRKVNGDTAEIEGEEVQKMFLRGCRTYTEK